MWVGGQGAVARQREQGQVVPLLALVVLAVGGLCVGLGRLGSDAVASARAQTAADAAALAGAATGPSAARAVAERNGATLVAYRRDGRDVEVRAEVGDVQAVARARRIRRAPAGGAGVTGLVPELRAALARAAALLGREVPITSGWRSRAEQQRLHDNRASNPFPVARPGRSAHERGTAVDVPRSFVPDLASVAAATGLCQPMPDTDPVHFELCPERRLAS